MARFTGPGEIGLDLLTDFVPVAVAYSLPNLSICSLKVR